jgi:hypothetical protein
MAGDSYLDLLEVTRPRLTQNGYGRRRRQAKNRGLLLQVRDAFDALGADRLSSALLVAYLDTVDPDWCPRTLEHVVSPPEVRANHLAARLLTHGVPLHRGLYGKRKARGVWRTDVDQAIRRTYSDKESPCPR